jgi:hypothetical protein
VIGVRIEAFALILIGAALIPAPVRASEAFEQSTETLTIPTPNPTPEAQPSPQTAGRRP